MSIWPFINPASPAATDKVKFGDDVIRAGKAATITALQTISNYLDNGGTVAALRTAVWTTAGRPSGTDLVDRVTGYNTTFGCAEYYDLASTTWRVFGGLAVWTVATRPTTLYAGEVGYNSDLAVIERYSGSAWVRVSGGRRGDIKMWSGLITDIESGWVLADGVQRNHPEGGIFTPPDLRDKFLVGAGNTYAVAGTGGEATHVLTVTEMPSHRHLIHFTADTTGYGDSRYGGDSSDTSQSKYTDYIGSNGAHNNLPPYYALCYLYKI